MAAIFPKVARGEKAAVELRAAADMLEREFARDAHEPSVLQVAEYSLHTKLVIATDDGKPEIIARQCDRVEGELNAMQKAVKSMRANTAPGIDGLRLDWMRACLSTEAKTRHMVEAEATRAAKRYQARAAKESLPRKATPAQLVDVKRKSRAASRKALEELGSTDDVADTLYEVLTRLAVRPELADSSVFTAMITLLLKPRGKGVFDAAAPDFSLLRAISVRPMVLRALTRVGHDALQPCLAHHEHGVCAQQVGFRARVSGGALRATCELLARFYIARARGHDLTVVTADAQGAYDRLHHQGLVSLMMLLEQPLDIRRGIVVSLRILLGAGEFSDQQVRDEVLDMIRPLLHAPVAPSVTAGESLCERTFRALGPNPALAMEYAERLLASDGEGSLQGDTSPGTIAHLLRVTLSKATAHVVGDGLSRAVPIRRGLGQGDNLAPTAFVIATDPALQAANDACEELDRAAQCAPMRCLFGPSSGVGSFADDFFAASESTQTLEDVLSILQKEMAVMGQSFGWNKSFIMTMAALVQRVLAPVGGTGQERVSIERVVQST